MYALLAFLAIADVGWAQNNTLTKEDNVTLGSTNGLIFVYANGNPITISENSSEGGIIIAPENPAKSNEAITLSAEEANKTFIFGGKKDESVTTTKITVKSGSFKNVLAGGYGSDSQKSADVTTKAELIIEKGTIDGVFGGGLKYANVESSEITISDITPMRKDYSWVLCGGYSSGLSGNKYPTYKDSKNIVKSAKLTITGGTFCYIGVGGTEGYYGWTGTVNANISNATIGGGLFGVGSNGQAQNVTATLFKCTFNKEWATYTELAAINRGYCTDMELSFDQCVFPTSDFYACLGGTWKWAQNYQSSEVGVKPNLTYSFTNCTNTPELRLSNGLEKSNITVTGADVTAKPFSKDANTTITTFMLNEGYTWTFNNQLNISSGIILTNQGTIQGNINAEVETVDELKAAVALNANTTLTSTSYGDNNDIQSFGSITQSGVKIKAKDGLSAKPKVYGTFQLLAPDCEIQGLEFFIKGGSHPVKNSIDVVAMSAILKDNVFNMGDAATGAVGNGVCIWPYGEGEPNYVITGNTFNTFKATTSNWSSSGLLVTEELELSRFGEPFTTATKSKAITLQADIEKGFCKNNTFENCYTNYARSNWNGDKANENAVGKSPVYSFSYLSSNSDALQTALDYSKDGALVYISGELTIENDKHGYIKKAITLESLDPSKRAKIKGNIAIQAEGATVNNIDFAYERKSALFSQKNGISVFANKATLTGNTFTTTGDGTNGIVFYPVGSDNIEQNYTVTGNTFNLAGASSTGIIVRENFASKSQIPDVATTASLSNGPAFDQQIIASDSKNTFDGSMTGGYYVRVTGNYSEKDGTGSGSEEITQEYLYSYLNATQAAEAIFCTQNGCTILTEDSYSDVVTAANELTDKPVVPAGVTIKCKDAYLVTDVNTADKISEAGAQVYILSQKDNNYEAMLKAIAPTVDASSLTATTIEAGQTLSVSILSGGSAKVGEKEISGVFTWKDPATVVEEGDHTYPVLFTPNDLVTYNTVETSLEIKGIKQYYIVTTGKCANGKVVIEDANEANKYEKGRTLKVTAVPDANYKFKAWGENISDSYSVTEDATLTAEFEAIEHAVTLIVEGGNGGISVNGKTDHAGSVTVQQGSEITVQAIPEDNYILESLTCSDNKIISQDAVTVDKPFTITAKFKEKPAQQFIVKVTSPEHGKILLYDENGNSIPAGSAVGIGTKVSVLAVADEGYVQNGSLKNGDDVITGGVISISADADIKAEFALQHFAVTTSIEEEAGSISLEGATAGENVDYGTSVKATVTENDGYKLLSLLVNGKEIPNGGSFTVTAVTEVKAVMRKLATIAIDETVQTVVYDGTPKVFIVKTIPAGIGGFTVTYGESKDNTPPTDAADNDKKAYKVTITRAADDIYAAVNEIIEDGLIIKAAEMKGIAVPTATDGTINNATIDGVGSFAWDGEVGEKPIHDAIFTPNNKNYAKSTFSIPTGKGTAKELDFEWESILTKSTLRSSEGNLTIHTNGNGSVILMNGSTQLNGGKLYVDQKIRLKAIPGKDASANVTWVATGGTLDRATGDEVILTLASGENTVTATFIDKKEPDFPGMDNIEDAIYNGTVFGDATEAPSVKQEGVYTGWQISFKQKEEGKEETVIPAPTNAGEYHIFASRSEDAGYKSVIDKPVGTFKIQPKEITATVTAASPILKGQALAQSIITGTADADGSFEWNTNAVNTPVTNTNTLKDQPIKFVPTSKNYKEKTGLKNDVEVKDTKGVVLRTVNLSITNPDKGTVTMKLNDQQIESGAIVTKGDKLVVTFEAISDNYSASATIGGIYTEDSPYTYTIDETGNNVDVKVSFTDNNPGGSDEPGGEPVTPDAIAVTGIKLDATSKTLAVGESFTLKATVEPANADNKKVRWSSSNSTIASVDKDGKVQALQAGTCKITVTTDDGDYTADCEITVSIATGIDEILAANRIYSESGQIIIEPTASLEVWITDMTGKIVYRSRITDKTQVTVYGGLYLVRLVENDKMATVKVIVK